MNVIKERSVILKNKQTRYVLYSGLVLGGCLFLGIEPILAEENSTLLGQNDISNSKFDAVIREDLTTKINRQAQTEEKGVESDDNTVQVVSDNQTSDGIPTEAVRPKAVTKVSSQEVETTSLYIEKDTLQIQYNSPHAPQEQVSFAVWTDHQGQDDLLWYLADAQGKAQVPLKKHGEFGLYQVHTYSKLGASMIFRDQTSVEVPKPEPKVYFEALTDATYRIRVSDLDETITSVSVPIWSKRNGQDDLKWYEAGKQLDGSFETIFDAANHSYDKGYYFAHIYGYSELLGRQLGLAATEGFTLNPQEIKGQWRFNHEGMHWRYEDDEGQVLKTAETISTAIDSGTSHPFLIAIYDGAIESLKYGVLPSITAAQAILESGWGKSGLSAQPNHNLFGIKASSDWEGETVSLPTQEFVNGRYITINDAFRKYKSWSESVLDHSKFFTSTPWRKENYKEFVGELNYKVAAQKLYQAGYATDPNYASKLIELIEMYGLDKWDRVID